MTTHNDMDYDSLLKDASIQMAASHLSRRPNRNSYGLASKRHSARIEKPRSIHPSPTAQERRRTVSATKYYPSLEDHYRAMFGEEASKPREEVEHPRPFSWHPTSSHMQSQTTDSSSSGELHMGLPFMMPETPMSYTVSSDMPGSALPPQQYDLPNTSYGPPQSITYPTYHNSQDVSSWQSYFDDQTPVFSTFPSYATLPDESTSWYTPDYSQLVQEQPQLLESTAPFQDVLLPIQKPDTPRPENDEADELDEDDGEVLVGLGLYDPPESSPPPFGLSEGKSLKLAETWQPPEPKDEDEDDDEDDKSSEEGEDMEEATQQQQQAETPSARNMAGQSFFFEEDDSVAGEWWYKQLKQPTARHAGVGFGWLQTA